MGTFRRKKARDVRAALRWVFWVDCGASAPALYRKLGEVEKSGQHPGGRCAHASGMNKTRTRRVGGGLQIISLQLLPQQRAD